MESEALLAARDVALGYGGAVVLQGVTLRVSKGDFWCWIGPNGSGKSTLLRACLGLLRPLEGSLERAWERDPRVRIGYVPQRSEWSDALPTTVRELVELGLVGVQASRPERAESVRWALDRVGLAGMERHGFAWLSGGQRQRALLARALVRRPVLLVLDEPTEGLDVATNDALLATLDALHREAALTLLVVTHRLEIVRSYADHIALFDAGRVVSGPREAVLASEVGRRALAGARLGLA